MADQQIDYAALAAEHGGTARSEAPPPPAGTWEDRGIGGQVWHPATPAADERADHDVVGGLPLIGGISPEMLVSGGVGIARAAAAPAANLLGRAYAISRSIGEQVTPQIKYEVTKTGLQSMGVPAPLAMAAALAVSGYRRGPKAAPPAEAPSGPHLDRSVPMQPGQMTQQQLGERLKFGTGAPPPPAGPKPMAGVTGPSGAPPVEPVASSPVAPAPQAAAPPPPGVPGLPPSGPPSTAGPAPIPAAPPPAPALDEPVIRMGPDGRLVGRPGGNPNMPDQRALNEAALATRRAAYQARLANTTAPEPVTPPAPTGNVKLSAAETIAFKDLLQRGMSGADALKNVLMQRDLVQRLGSPTPTAAQTRFPKGMRGKS